MILFNLTVDKGVDIDLGAGVVFPSIEDPLSNGNDEDDAERDDTVVHVVGGNFLLRREHKQDSRQDGPGNSDLGSSHVSRYAGMYTQWLGGPELTKFRNQPVLLPSL